MWVARSKNGKLHLYDEIPQRKGEYWRAWQSILIDSNLFLNLKWEDEAIEVELKIKEN